MAEFIEQLTVYCTKRTGAEHHVRQYLSIISSKGKSEQHFANAIKREPNE